MNDQRGYTLVELLTVFTIGMTLIAVTFTLTSSFLQQTLSSSKEAHLNTDVALLINEFDKLLEASAIKSSNDITDLSKLGGWASSETEPIVLIASVYSLDGPGGEILRDLAGVPYTDEYIYYQEGSTLYRRTLVTIPSPLGGYRDITCDTPGSPATCAKSDLVLTKNLHSISISYLDATNSPTDPDNARSVTLAVELGDVGLREELRASLTKTVTLRNE